MASILRKVARFYAYPIVRPVEIIGDSIKGIGATLKDASGNVVDPENQLTFDEVKENREFVADLIEERDKQRELAGRRIGLFVLGVFGIICVVGLWGFVAAIIARDIPSAKSHAINFLVGLCVCLGGALWVKTFFAKRHLPSIEELQIQFIRIKRILVLMLTISIGVLIVNILLARLMGTVLSIAVISLIFSYVFRYSLRIEQLRTGHSISAKVFFEKAGWKIFFDMEFSE
jgi:hypothetical protein